MLEHLWTEVEENLGRDDIKWHRAGLALADVNQTDTDNTEFEKQQNARKTLQIQINASVTFLCFFLALFAVLVGLLLQNGEAVEIFKKVTESEMDNKLSHFSVAVVSSILVLVVLAIAHTLKNLHDAVKILQPGIEKSLTSPNHLNESVSEKTLDSWELFERRLIVHFNF